MRSPNQWMLLPLIGLSALVLGETAAAGTPWPWAACQKARYAASAKYVACQQKGFAAYYGGVIDARYAALAKCRTKYTATWARLQAKAIGSGSICDHPRYDDLGNGTVMDRLTGLQWEQKTDDGTVHDKDSDHSLSESDGDTTDADGTAYTTFLATLNTGACFAGHCDWRLPTVYELQTIADEASVVTPVFGPTIFGSYWSSTSDVRYPEEAWLVGSFDGGVVGELKYFSVPVRAVRGGL